MTICRGGGRVVLTEAEAADLKGELSCISFGGSVAARDERNVAIKVHGSVALGMCSHCRAAGKGASFPDWQSIPPSIRCPDQRYGDADELEGA